MADVSTTSELGGNPQMSAVKTLAREFMAEFFGCFVIVFIGCGSVSNVAGTILGISLSFGMAVYVLI